MVSMTVPTPDDDDADDIYQGLEQEKCWVCGEPQDEFGSCWNPWCDRFQAYRPEDDGDDEDDSET